MALSAAASSPPSLEENPRHEALTARIKALQARLALLPEALLPPVLKNPSTFAIETVAADDDEPLLQSRVLAGLPARDDAPEEDKKAARNEAQRLLDFFLTLAHYCDQAPAIAELAAAHRGENARAYAESMEQLQRFINDDEEMKKPITRKDFPTIPTDGSKFDFSTFHQRVMASLSDKTRYRHEID